MFQASEVIDAVKNLAKSDITPQLSHCQALDHYAKRLGYESFNHFREYLEAIPSDRLGKFSLKLMRHICASRTPSLECAYFEFMELGDSGFGYYSHWIGWDSEGEEVRVPRALNGRGTATGLRNLAKYPVYVVESARELLAWRHKWHSTALIPESLARKHFPLSFNKDFRVEENPPIEKVMAKINRYTHNIARD